MAEEVTETVKKVSSGTVKIAIEEYQDLLAKAAEKAPVIYRTVQKTPAMQAADNKLLGGVLFGGGVALCILGGVAFGTGLAQSKAL